jgi:hypothetical protein
LIGTDIAAGAVLQFHLHIAYRAVRVWGLDLHCFPHTGILPGRSSASKSWNWDLSE